MHNFSRRIKALSGKANSNQNFPKSWRRHGLAEVCVKSLINLISRKNRSTDTRIESGVEVDVEKFHSLQAVSNMLTMNIFIFLFLNHVIVEKVDIKLTSANVQTT